MSRDSIACSVFLITASSVGAQASDTREEVTISSQRLEETLAQELSRYGTRVETVSATQIKNGEYYDVGEAIRALVPGLYLTPRAGGFDYVDLSFQGSRTGDILWLIDGVRLNNRLYNTTTPIDTIPAHMVERIEVLEGGQSLFYGTQALAGAVNIVTKDFAHATDGAISVAADTNEGRHVNGRLRGSVRDQQFVVYGSSDRAEGFRPFRRSDFQPSATDRKRGYEVETIGGKYAIDLTETTRVTALYQHTDAKLDHAQPKFIATAINERDEDILSVKVDVSPNRNLQLFLKGYYHWWDAYYSETDTSAAGPPILVSDREFWGFEDYGANLLLKLATHQGFDYFIGYDLQRYSGQDDVLLIARQAETVQAPFVQVRTTPALLPKLQLAAGVRHNESQKAQSATVWTLSGHWQQSELLFIRANAGTAFRLPDAYELFAIDPCCEIGNPDLKPEESEHLNLSVGGSLPLGRLHMNWEAVGFLRNVKNLITPVHDPQRGVDTHANVDQVVRVRGAELLLSTKMFEALAASASATVTEAEHSGSGLQVQDIPTWHFKLGLDYERVNGRVGASLSVNRIGSVFRDLGIGRQEFGNYAIVSVGARVYLDVDRRHRLGMRLENAFDEEYATRVRQTTPDGGGQPYAYWHLGTPRALHVSYTFDF